jgi:hypothetical protein
VRLVLQVLKREKFYVCKAKSGFAQKEIKYLGHIVNKQGIRPDPKKVEAGHTSHRPLATDIEERNSNRIRSSPTARKIMVTLRLPLSITLDSAPVLRSRWKAMSRCRMWSKKCIATRRPVAWPTGLNTT